MTKQLPTLFLFRTEPRHYAPRSVDVLCKLKAEGKINNKVVMLSVADQFGADLQRGGTPVLQGRGLRGRSEQELSDGLRDLSTEIKQAKDSGADSFVAFSYPGDTFMMTHARHPGLQSEGVLHRASAPPSPLTAQLDEKAQGVLGPAAGIRTHRARRTI